MARVYNECSSAHARQQIAGQSDEHFYHSRLVYPSAREVHVVKGVRLGISFVMPKEDDESTLEHYFRLESLPICGT